MQCAEKYPEKLFFTAHNIEPIFDSKFLNLMPYVTQLVEQ